MNNITPDHIRDIFSYSRKFSGSVFVLYIDEAVVYSDALYALAKDMTHMLGTGIRIVAVPGMRQPRLGVSSGVSAAASPAAPRKNSAAAHKAEKTIGQKAAKIIGQKIGQNWEQKTSISEQEIAAIQSASFEIVSRVITALARERQTAVLGNWMLARSLGVIDGTDYKHLGVAEKIDAAAVQKLLADGVIPIFPAIGWSYTGTQYYVNPMDIAAETARSLGASKLIFLTDEDARKYFARLTSSGAATAEQCPRLSVSEAKRLLSKNPGLAQEPLVAAASRAVRALETGVERVHLLNGRTDGELLTEIFFNAGSGLMIHADEYEAIAPMQKEDAADALQLMKPLMEQNILKPRSLETLLEQRGDFVVYKTDNRIRGAAALHDIGEGCAEIAALATAQDTDSKGVGKKLMQYLMLQAKKRKFKKVYVMTLKTGDWFERLGFKKVENKDELPKKRLESLQASKRASRVYVMETKKIREDSSDPFDVLERGA